MDIASIVESAVAENPAYSIEPDKVAEAIASKVIEGGPVGDGHLDPLIHDVCLDGAIYWGVGEAIYELDGEEFEKVHKDLRQKVQVTLTKEAKAIASSILRQLAKAAAEEAEAVA